MTHDGLRGLLAKAEELGELRVLKGVDWNLEIGTLNHVSQHEMTDPPILLFDEIKGYQPGYRVAVNWLSTDARLDSVVGLPTGGTRIQDIERWRHKLKDVPMIAPEFVEDGPILENVHLGKDVDVLEFPTPFWHEKDGGRYIGTGSCTITKDPDSDWINLGTYRVMVHDSQTVGFYVSPGHHARIHRDKYWERGEPCPVAISLGQDPLLFLVSTMHLPQDVPEYAYAGGLRGSPIRVVKGPVTGLPIPADAEIVIEGEAYPGDLKTEGPFGEWTGHYGSSMRPEPFIRVKSVLHRNNPILTGAPPGRPPSDGSFVLTTPLSALLWNQLEAAGIPDIKGVYRPEFTGGNTFVIVSIKQRYAGHSRQTAWAVAGSVVASYIGRYIIIVDDDIDPTNIKDVMWAMAFRSDPQRSIDILRECQSSVLDPVIPIGQKGLNSKAVIDACRPYQWIQDFPPMVQPSPAHQKEMWERWRGEITGQGGDRR